MPSGSARRTHQRHTPFPQSARHCFLWHHKRTGIYIRWIKSAREHCGQLSLVCTDLPNSFPIFFPKLPLQVDRETVRNWHIFNCPCFNTLRQALRSENNSGAAAGPASQVLACIGANREPYSPPTQSQHLRLNFIQTAGFPPATPGPPPPPTAPPPRSVCPPPPPQPPIPPRNYGRRSPMS